MDEQGSRAILYVRAYVRHYNTTNDLPFFILLGIGQWTMSASRPCLGAEVEKWCLAGGDIADKHPFRAIIGIGPTRPLLDMRDSITPPNVTWSNPFLVADI